MYPVIQQWRRQGVEDNFNTQGRLKYLLLTPLWDKKFKYHIPGNAFRGNCSDSLNLHLQKTLYFFWQSEILDIEVFCMRDIIHDGRSCQRALEAPCQSIVPYSNMFFEFWNWNWNHLRFPKLKKCIHSLYWLLWGRYWATTARWFTHKRHIDHTVHLIITSNTVIVQSILNYIKYNNTMNTGQIVINVSLHFQCHFWSICATFPPQNAMVKFPLDLGFSELACFHIDITNFSLYLLRIFFISYFSYHFNWSSQLMPVPDCWMSWMNIHVHVWNDA